MKIRSLLVHACWFCLLAFGNGCSSGSGTDPFLPGDPVDPNPPSDVGSFSGTPGLESVTLSWDAASDDIEVSGYRVSLVSPQLPIGGPVVTSRIVAADVTSVQFVGLDGGTDYTFTIVAIDSSNNVSANVATVVVTPFVPDLDPPNDVTDLSGAGGFNNPALRDFVVLNLTWTDSTSVDVSHYLLCVGTSDGNCDILNNFNVGNLTSLTIPDDTNGPVSSGDLGNPLVIDQDYFVRVIVVDTSGNQSSPGATNTVTPTESVDGTPPDAVRNLNAIPDNRQVVLTWEEPLPIGDANVFSVYVRALGNEETVAWELFQTTSANTSTVTTHSGAPLLNGQLYEFMVAGLDDSANETVGASTPSTPDDIAAKVSAVPTSNQIEASPNFQGGVFREEYFVARSIVIMVSTDAAGLLDATANTRIFYTLDGSGIDTNDVSSSLVKSSIPFSDVAVVEVEAGVLYAVTIDFDPVAVGTQNISANVLRPNGAADHVDLRYIVRTAGDASRLFSEVYLIYPGLSNNDYFKFSGMRAQRSFTTLTRIEAGNTEGDLIVIGGTAGPFNIFGALDSASRYRVRFEHFESLNPAGLSSLMSDSRAFHASTLLPDSADILVTGGFNSAGQSAPANGAGNETLGLRSTELFRSDAANEGFVAGRPDMDAVRNFHTSTRLFGAARAGAARPGTVLIVGGLNGETVLRGTLANLEVVVPTPGTVDPSPTRLTFDPANLGTAVGFVVGSVIEKISGGAVYDTGVVTNSTPNGVNENLQDLRIEGLITDNLAGDDFRLINAGTSSMELFAADGSNSGVAAPFLREDRYGHTATLLRDGSVFVCGGVFDYRSSINPRSDGINEFSTEIYSPDPLAVGGGSVTRLSRIAELPETRFFHTATLLLDGKVLITGGLERGDYMFRSNAFSGGANVWGSAYLFDPFARSLVRVGDMTKTRFFHSATLLPSGEVLLVGGYTAVDETGVLTLTDSAETYNPMTRSFSATEGNMITLRGPCAVETISTDIANLELAGKALVVGGSANTLAELYNPSTRSFEATAHNLTYDRALGMTSTRLQNGRVMLAGGQEGNLFASLGDILDTVEFYDSSQVQFIQSNGKMSVARRHHTSTLLLDGSVLLSGGENAEGGLDAAELYFPDTDTFADIARMTRKRYKHSATLLADGRVFICGGGNLVGPLQACEIYDPVLRSFESVPSLGVGRQGHSATLLSNGWVMVAGGESIDDRSVEFFDPVLNDFIPAPAANLMLVGRDSHSAVQPSYSLGQARFVQGSAIVTGSDFGSNPWGFESTNWATAGVQPGDVIISLLQNRPYVIATVAEFSLTLANHPDFTHDDSGFSGESTAFRLTGNNGGAGFEPYMILSQDVYILGGEIATMQTEVFDFDPGADEWPLADPTDYSFIAASLLTQGHASPATTSLSDFSLVVTGGRNLLSGQFTTLVGAISDFTDDTWTSSALDPATTDLDFPVSFRVDNNMVIIVHQHSARVFIHE